MIAVCPNQARGFGIIVTYERKRCAPAITETGPGFIHRSGAGKCFENLLRVFYFHFWRICILLFPFFGDMIFAIQIQIMIGFLDMGPGQ